jgi:outer membrane protein TolC
MLPFVLSAQSSLSLTDCIQWAKENSSEAHYAKTNYDIATYDYKLYRKSLLPTLTLSGDLPTLNRTISKITLPDGRESFVAQSAGNYAASLSLNQPIPFTGGNFYVSTGLQRLDIYHDGTATSYLGNLINIGIRQPIMAFNAYKWQKKIAPVQYQKAERDYIESLEDAALQAINLFFDLLKTQTSLALMQQNRANSDTLLSIAQERFSLGKITEDALLEVEVSQLNFRLQIEGLQNLLNEQQTAIADFLCVSQGTIPLLTLPETVGVTTVSQEKAIQKAIANGTLPLEHRQRRLQAESEVARAKADNGFSVNLYASFGISKNDALLKNVYRNPLDQEQISLSFNIPILDWGVAKYRYKKAQLALDNENNRIEKEQLEFQRSVKSAVNQYNIQTSQLVLMQKSIELANKRYEMSRERYISGKINFLEYSVAQNDKDNAQIQYLQTLQKCWTNYYQLRKLTLFDFVSEREISDYR